MHARGGWAYTAGFGTALGFSGAAATAATAFGNSFLMGSIDGIVSGNFDLNTIIGDAFKSAVTAGVTAGISNALLGGAEQFDELGELIKDPATGAPILTKGPLTDFIQDLPTDSILGFGNGNLSVQNLMSGGVESMISAGVNTLVYGTDFSDGFTQSLASMVVNLTLADVQFEIGSLGDDIENWEGSSGHAILHGLAGCAAATAQGADCAAGAAGGIAQSIYAGTTDEIGRHLNAEEYTNTAEFIGAFAGYLFSSGKAENVNVAALVAESGFENNALCGGVCIAALLAAGYVLLSGDGNPIEGLQTMGRGEDLLSELAAAGTEKGIAFASSHFPEETAAVIEALVAAGEVTNVAITYIDDATGNTISGTWNEFPTGVQDAIKGGAIVATFVIPAGAATKIGRAVPTKRPGKVDNVDNADDFNRNALPVPDDLGKSIHNGAQDKHVLGTNNYDPRRSTLTANPQELLDGIHSGQYVIIREIPRGNSTTNIVDFGKPIGDFKSNGTFVGPTQYGQVVQSKNGVHIIPANPNQF